MTFNLITIPTIKNRSPITLLEFILSEQQKENKKTLYGNRAKVKADLDITHTAIRPFMRPGDSEPNEHYRPWLEEHIGKQGVDWDWDIHSVMSNSLCISFVNPEHGVLFELTWK